MHIYLHLHGSFVVRSNRGQSKDGIVNAQSESNAKERINVSEFIETLFSIHRDYW